MRALLDVNVLIALLDSEHISHAKAMEWFTAHAEHGWASCAITQNECLRIMSHPAYPNVQPVTAIAARLRQATGHPVHTFWSGDISALDESRIDTSRVHSPRQLANVYLLALAVANNGCLVTFEHSVSLAAVTGATAAHLRLIDSTNLTSSSGAPTVRTQPMLTFGRDVRAFMQYVMRDAQRGSKVTREALVAALEAMSDDDVHAALKNAHASGDKRSGRLSLTDFLGKLVGNGPASLDTGAKEVLEAAMNRVIEDGRDVVTLADLRTAAKNSD